MSSHHIVREKQEPALLVLNLGDFPYESLGQLLEWSPTVIATPGSFDELNSNQTKVDWLITENQPRDIQNDVKIIKSRSGDYLTEALTALIKKGYTAVNIISNSLNIELLVKYTSSINMVIYADDEKIFPIKTGYQKWMPAGEIIGIKTSYGQVTTSGLEKITEQEYRVISDGIISINFPGHYLFIAERL